MVVKNAFGILSSKFPVFRSPIALKTSSIRSIVLAAIVYTTSKDYAKSMQTTLRIVLL